MNNETEILTEAEVEALRACLRRDVFPRVASTIRQMAGLLEVAVCGKPCRLRCEWCQRKQALLARYKGERT